MFIYCSGIVSDLRSFNLSEIEPHNRYRDRPRRDISKQRVVGNALSINPSCLKVRLKTNSKGSDDVRLSLKVGKQLGWGGGGGQN